MREERIPAILARKELYIRIKNDDSKRIMGKIHAIMEESGFKSLGPMMRHLLLCSEISVYNGTSHVRKNLLTLAENMAEADININRMLYKAKHEDNYGTAAEDIAKAKEEINQFRKNFHDNYDCFIIFGV